MSQQPAQPANLSSPEGVAWLMQGHTQNADPQSYNPNRMMAGNNIPSIPPRVFGGTDAFSRQAGMPGFAQANQRRNQMMFGGGGGPPHMGSFGAGRGIRSPKVYQ